MEDLFFNFVSVGLMNLLNADICTIPATDSDCVYEHAIIMQLLYGMDFLAQCGKSYRRKVAAEVNAVVQPADDKVTKKSYAEAVNSVPIYKRQDSARRKTGKCCND